MPTLEWGVMSVVGVMSVENWAPNLRGHGTQPELPLGGSSAPVVSQRTSGFGR